MFRRKTFIKAVPVERLIFWSMALLMLVNLGWWLFVQIQETGRLMEARIALMRAARAEAWQQDTMTYIWASEPSQELDTTQKAQNPPPDIHSMAERKRMIEENYPCVTVVEHPVDADDPGLLSDPPLYLTLRQESLQAEARHRSRALWSIAIQAVLFVTGILMGLVYVYRKLNTEMRRTFIDNVTHELKTPIASLRVWTETLFTRELQPDVKQRIQDLMESDLTRLTSLVNNLLDVAKADAGRLDLHLELVEMSRFVRQTALAIDHRLGAGSLGLYLDLEADVWVECDPKAMATILENLLNNAYKYSGEPRQTKVTVDSDNQHVFIVITDKGHGIRARDLPRLFQRFYRVRDDITRAVPGTGMGLFLCKELLSRQGGDIKAYSLGSGLGSSFTIRLPKASSIERPPSHLETLPIG